MPRLLVLPICMQRYRRIDGIACGHCFHVWQVQPVGPELLRGSEWNGYLIPSEGAGWMQGLNALNHHSQAYVHTTFEFLSVL